MDDIDIDRTLEKIIAKRPHSLSSSPQRDPLVDLQVAASGGDTAAAGALLALEALQQAAPRPMTPARSEAAGDINC